MLTSHKAGSVATLYIDIDAAEFEDSQIQDIGALFINMGCLMLSLQWEPQGINSIGKDSGFYVCVYIYIYI